jgi:hypothetical protein
MISCPSYVASPVIRFPVERRETISLQSGAEGNDLVVCVAPHQAMLGFSFVRTSNASGATNNWFVPPLPGPSTTARVFVDPYLQNLFTAANGVARYRWVSLCVEVIDTTAVASASGEAFFVRPPWSRIDSAPPAGQHSAGTPAANEAEDWYNNLLSSPGLQPMTAATLMGGVCGHVTMSSRRAVEFEDLMDAPSNSNTYSTQLLSTDYDYGWRGKYSDVNFSTNAPSLNSPMLASAGEPLWRPAYMIVGREANAASRRLTLVFKGTVEVIPSEVSFLTRLARPLRPASDGDEERWWAHQTRMSYLGAVRPSRAPLESRSAAGVLGAKPGLPKPKQRPKPPQARPQPARPAKAPVGAKLMAAAAARKKRGKGKPQKKKS